MDKGKFVNLEMDLGSSGGYFGKLEMGLDISGEAFGNLPERWHNLYKHSDSDEM